MKNMVVTYPPPLMTSESFARHTVAQRLPSIVADVMAENAYPAGVVAALHALQDEIAVLALCWPIVKSVKIARLAARSPGLAF